MTTKKTTLQAGNVIETLPLFPSLTTEQVLLVVNADGSLTALYYGVVIASNLTPPKEIK